MQPLHVTAALQYARARADVLANQRSPRAPGLAQVLILDEPTSGLDSTTAMNLLSTLRALASEGRTVLTTIHQPSSRLYRQLDRIILMADGHMMYSGRGDAAADWFAALGCKLPYGVNVADFILDLSSATFETPGPILGAQGAERKGRLVEAAEVRANASSCPDRACWWPPLSAGFCQPLACALTAASARLRMCARRTF